MEPTVRIVISSMGRAGKVTTLRHFERCELYVPESEEAEYRRFYPKVTITTHPDSLVGIDAKRQHLLEQGGDQFHLDDDSIGVYRIYRRAGAWKKAVMTPSRAVELIDRTCETARQMGAYFFGFSSHCNPMTFNGLRPFRFGGYTPGGAWGLREGSKVFLLRETGTVRPLPIGDYWICLLNSYFHRYAWLDCRFAVGFRGTYTNRGGGAFQREPIDGVDAEVLATEFLQRHFGSDVVQPNTHGSSFVTRVMHNPGRRLIDMPYRV